MFPKNEGSLDRDLRIALGVVLAIVAVFYLQGLFAVVFGILSLVLLVTSAIGFCPIYKVIGINTAQSQK
ncbi:MAG: DUF2892 domain-containing protein [Roseiflexaceae bacterium]|nr:DUF2892 domain-containing protein [Roseiflexaceae bacterium]